MKTVTATLVVALGCLVAAGAAAEAPSSPTEAGNAGERDHSAYYAQGLQHFAEGRENQAVEALFRAYGIEPSAAVMELIVEAYDRMGHCQAAQRSRQFHRRAHAEQTAPQLDQCTNTAELIVDCEHAEAEAVINEGFSAGCNEVVELPADRPQQLRWRHSGERQNLQLDPGQRRELRAPEPDQEDYGRARVSRVRAEFVSDVPRLPFELDEHPEVPRLTLPSDFDRDSYRLLRTSDGLYRVYTREPSSPRSGADVEIICPDDAPHGEREIDCLLLREQMHEAP